MVTPRKRARTLANHHQQHQADDDGQIDATQKISRYEQCREERIKENIERMHKLGIHDLSLKLKSLKSTSKNSPSNRRTPQRPSPLLLSGPIRRSSRLQNVTPVSYSEVHLSKKDTSLEGEDDLVSEGFKPEVYTEKHEKLLGNTEMSWTLFVDGCGKDGKRIYDPVKGKTCHQCRQKTLGHRTHCSKCNMVQGQFCGDCLYMRYGEHVLEAKQNPNWICPVCRGICNCSLCRQAKGWPATGPLYKKVSSLGFKSVAHYLIQTRRIKADSENNSNTKVPVSAKRSLPFSDMEMTEDKEFPDSDLQGLVNPESVEKQMDYDHKSEKDGELSFPDSRSADKNFALAMNSCYDFKSDKEKEAHGSDSNHGDIILASEGRKEAIQNPVNNSGSTDDIQGASKPKPKFNEKCNEFKGEKEERNLFVDERGDRNIAFKSITEPVENPAVATDGHFASENTTEHMHKPAVAPNSSDHFRSDKEKEAYDLDNKHIGIIIASEGTKEPTQKPSISSGSTDDIQVASTPEPEYNGKCNKFKGEEEETYLFDNGHDEGNVTYKSISEPIPNAEVATDCGDDSQGLLNSFSEEKKGDGEIKGREEERVLIWDNKHSDSILAPQRCIRSNRKLLHVTKPNTDSIAGRLKRRHCRAYKEDEMESAGMNLHVAENSHSTTARVNCVAERLRSRCRRI